MLDREFFIERAAHCRSLAEKADPFIKPRLLELAARYDGRFSKRPSITTMLLDQFLEQSKAPSLE
jgi:hypothetical protein